MHKNTLTNDAMAKQRLTEQSQIVLWYFSTI